MNSRWLLLGTLSATVAISFSAEAANLVSWRFDSQQNRLVFQTDGSVRPKAQLIFNPTRIVIDLPGTRLGSSMQTQSFNEAIEQVRVAQFDRNTTRLVIALAPGYTVDPQQISIRGQSPTQWSVQLPSPQWKSGQSSAAPPLPAPSPSRVSPPPARSPRQSQLAVIESLSLEGGSQGSWYLLLNADRAIRVESYAWNPATRLYRLQIANARLSDRFRVPRRDPNNPFRGGKAYQRGNAAIIEIELAAGVNAGDPLVVGSGREIAIAVQPGIIILPPPAPQRLQGLPVDPPIRPLPATPPRVTPPSIIRPAPAPQRSPSNDLPIDPVELARVHLKSPCGDRCIVP